MRCSKCWLWSKTASAWRAMDSMVVTVSTGNLPARPTKGPGQRNGTGEQTAPASTTGDQRRSRQRHGFRFWRSSSSQCLGTQQEGSTAVKPGYVESPKPSDPLASAPRSVSATGREISLVEHTRALNPDYLESPPPLLAAAQRPAELHIGADVRHKQALNPRQISRPTPRSVSAPSRKASAPSMMALATSVASARVGRGELDIVSTSRVTMMGLPCDARSPSPFVNLNILSINKTYIKDI